ncbi:hypothetical protein Taro_044296 [Colocasia esculenta]|uniref:Secreted protein n=1 Tax=Colocasia esculenta TaxID=4460 RepID=A0A843X0I6_COLES|nr:hypothetical protein [Colocasia esculenta]
MALACVASRLGSVSGVVLLVGPRPCRGLRCAEHCFRFVSDSVGFCGSRVCATTLVGGRGIVLFSSAT